MRAILLSLIFFIFLEALFSKYTTNFWLFLLVGFVFFNLIVFLFYFLKNFKKISWIKLLMPNLLFLGIALNGFFILDKQLILQFTILVASILLYLNFKNWDNFPVNLYLIGASLNFLDFLCLFVAFLWYFSLYQLALFLSLPIWSVLLIVAIISFLILFYILWSNEITLGTRIFYSSLFSFLISEIFLTLSFWPTDASFKSLILLLYFYLFWPLLKLRLGKNFTFKNILPYFLISSLIFLLIIFKIKWESYY